MRKIGIVGGVAWQSTAEYYSQICRRAEQLHHARNLPEPAAIPEIAIESLDLAKAVAYLGAEDDEPSWERFDDYHREALQGLQVSGAEVALMASITAHTRFDAIVSGITIPVINIIDELAKESAWIGVKRVLLLGTDSTMRSGEFRRRFANFGVEAIAPTDEADRAKIVQVIRELQCSQLSAASEDIVRIARRSLAQNASHQAAVCLACTELPLVFGPMRTMTSFEYGQMRFINAIAVHVEAAFKFAAEY